MIPHTTGATKKIKLKKSKYKLKKYMLMAAQYIWESKILLTGEFEQKVGAAFPG